MKTYTTASFSSALPCVTALGCFDGVHLGHAALISQAVKIAHSQGLQAAVWSFAAPPKNYFSKDKVQLLTTHAEKRELCRGLGVDIFVSAHFNGKIADMSAEHFFEEVLIARMSSKHIVCGYNYRFGKSGKGDVSLLRSLCKAYGISLSVIPEVRVENVSVSSSEIRHALAEGKIENANAMLGRPYSLRAAVCDGQHLGRQLGFPTINQVFDESKLLPANGVYVSRVRLDQAEKFGITNIGIRPTVGGNLLCAETHIFDLEADLYGKSISVELLHFIRPEQKFLGLDKLKAQVHADIQTAKNFLESIKQKKD